MEYEKIFRQTEKIFKEVLDNQNIKIKENTTQNDIEEWDSLTYIQLIDAIEKEFDIQFYSNEIGKWKNVGAICKSIEEKLQNNH